MLISIHVSLKRRNKFWHVLDLIEYQRRRIVSKKEIGVGFHPVDILDRIKDEGRVRIAEEARKGKRVVRLKGGDAGIFGRLAEEVAELERLALPYRIIPGVSAFQTVAATTGMQLTRRGETSGFEVTTDEKGLYRFCSVPAEMTLYVSGAHGDQESGVYEVQIGMDERAGLQAIEIGANEGN